jgi:adenylyltransferase/sulfurtransferase
VCGPDADIRELVDYDEFCGVPGRETHDGSAGMEWDITPLELFNALKQSPPPLLVDVREPHEQQIASLPGAINLPLGAMAAHLSELDSTRDMVLFCKAGTRSTRALELLVSAGFRRVKNLKGGLNAWAREIDPTIPTY